MIRSDSGCGGARHPRRTLKRSAGKMMLDAQADRGRLAWLPCAFCGDTPLYLLDYDVNLVWLQCCACLRRCWHDTGVGSRRHPQHPFELFDAA